ncbi:hypothetical protein B9Z52_10655 [Limnohabitans sp. Jir72]|nr:hypothetical protein B9Z52_10655 [Limnohabitans sp. Jir72]
MLISYQYTFIKKIILLHRQSIVSYIFIRISIAQLYAKLQISITIQTCKYWHRHTKSTYRNLKKFIHE